jgi:hypothetical protein
MGDLCSLFQVSGADAKRVGGIPGYGVFARGGDFFQFASFRGCSEIPFLGGRDAHPAPPSSKNPPKWEFDKAKRLGNTR